MSNANWPVVGGIYRDRNSDYSRRVVAIDGETVHTVWSDNSGKSVSVCATSFRKCHYPEDQSPIPALVEALQYVVDHPCAAYGMGDKPHAERVEMQRLATEALALAKSAALPETKTESQKVEEVLV